MIDNNSKTNGDTNCKLGISLTKTLFIGMLLNMLDDGVNPEGLKEFYRKTMKDSSWVEQLIDAWINSRESDDSELAAVTIDMISGHTNTLNTDYETKYAKLQQEFTILKGAALITGTDREYIVDSFEKYHVRKGYDVTLDQIQIKNIMSHCTAGTTTQGINVSMFTNYISSRALYDLKVHDHTEVKVVININSSTIAFINDSMIMKLLCKAMLIIDRFYFIASSPNIIHDPDIDMILIDFAIFASRRDHEEPTQKIIDALLSTIPMLFCKFLDAVSESNITNVI